MKYRQKKSIKPQNALNIRLLYRDALIPTISAVLGSVITLLVGQIFFFNSNAKSQVEYELRKEIYKEQLPIINRILNITNDFTLVSRPYVFSDGGVYMRIITYMDSNDNVIRKDSIVHKDTTINVTIPEFIYEDRKRQIFIANMNNLKTKLRSLEYDQDLILAMEEVLYFIDKNPIPENMDNQVMFYTKWNDNENIKKWYALISKLRSICIKKKKEFNLK